MEPESAETWKLRGNEEFRVRNYAAAEQCYSKAIELSPEPSAVFLNNRATTRFYLDFMGLCIEDATAAIQADPSFFKAYYRRAEAYMILENMQAAKSDYFEALKLKPSDQLIRRKYEHVAKLIKKRRFLDAIYAKQLCPIEELLSIFPSPESPHSSTESHSGSLAICQDTPITPELFWNIVDHCAKGEILDARSFAALIGKMHNVLLDEMKDPGTQSATSSPSSPVATAKNNIPQAGGVMLRRALNVSEKETKEDEMETGEGDSKALTVIGDIHGQVFDLVDIIKRRWDREETLKLWGDCMSSSSSSVTTTTTTSDNTTNVTSKESETHKTPSLTVFLGDFVDRRDHGVAVLQLIFALRVLVSPQNWLLIHPEVSSNKNGGEGENNRIFKSPLQDIFGDVVLIRGNHESEQMNRQFGFEQELKRSYDPSGPKAITLNKGCKSPSVLTEKLLSAIYKIYGEMALCCVLGWHSNSGVWQDKIFCVHGGVPCVDQQAEEISGKKKAEGESYLDRLSKLPRSVSYGISADPSEPSGPQLEMLWNDPVDISLGPQVLISHVAFQSRVLRDVHQSPRGCGCVYGDTACSEWMKNAGICCVFRGHQMVEEGIREDFKGGECNENGCHHITVFSCPKYCGSTNKGSCLEMTSLQLKELGATGALRYNRIDLEGAPDPLAAPFMPASRFFR